MGPAPPLPLRRLRRDAHPRPASQPAVRDDQPTTTAAAEATRALADARRRGIGAREPARRRRPRGPDLAAAQPADRRRSARRPRRWAHRGRRRRAGRRGALRRRCARRRPAAPPRGRGRRLHRDRGPLRPDRRRDVASGRSASCAPAPGPRAACACPRATRCSPTSCRPRAYGRAYGFERAMDNLGAIVGPLLGLALVAAGRRAQRDPALDHPRPARRAAIVYAIRARPRPEQRERQPIRFRSGRCCTGSSAGCSPASARSSSATSPRRC